MTMISEMDAARAERLLGRAMNAFETAHEMLDRAVEKLKAEEKISGTDLTKEIREMNNALLTALSLEEKARVASGKTRTGAGCLDLEAARAEIGCRLACLRAANDRRDVSGGTE
jgi:hypothetical protein